MLITPLAVRVGTLNENAVGGPMCGLPEPAVQDAQHRVGVGGGAHRGPGVGAHPLLVDDDRRGQAFEQVDLGPGQRRHEALHERAVGLVDHPLRLRGDRAEHQRALARAGDAGEHRQPALRDLDTDVFEVVHPRAVHADQIVAVGCVPRRWLVLVFLATLLIVSIMAATLGATRLSGASRFLISPSQTERPGLECTPRHRLTGAWALNIV